MSQCFRAVIFPWPVKCSCTPLSSLVRSLAPLVMKIRPEEKNILDLHEPELKCQKWAGEKAFVSAPSQRSTEHRKPETDKHSCDKQLGCMILQWQSEEFEKSNQVATDNTKHAYLYKTIIIYNSSGQLLHKPHYYYRFIREICGSRP